MLILAAAFTPAFGQNVCKLTVDQMPVVSGFWLTMDQAKAENLAGQKAEPLVLTFAPRGGGKRKPDPKRIKTWAGASYLTIDNSAQNSKAVDATVKRVDLSFYEGKLFEIEIHYTRKAEWAALSDPEEYFLKTYKLPKNIWQQDLSRTYYSRNAECKDVWVRYDMEPLFTLTQTDVRTRIDAAIKAAQAEADKPPTVQNPALW